MMKNLSAGSPSNFYPKYLASQLSLPVRTFGSANTCRFPDVEPGIVDVISKVVPENT